MHLSKEVNGPYTFLCGYCREDELINYQFHMINKSDQKVFLKCDYDMKLRYNVTSLMPIDVYFKSQCHTFERQKYIMKKLIDSIWVADQYLLDTSKIAYDKSYIFVDVQDLSIKLIYLPIKSYHMAFHSSLCEVFLSLLFTTEIKQIESDQRIKKMIGYLQRADFDVMIFSAMLDTLKSNEPKSKKNWLSQWLFKDKKALQAEECQTVLISKEEHYPMLQFEDKSILINQPSFLIGRSKTLVDYALPEALSIGRVHAEILCEGNNYYLVDMNTKNGTFINEERLESQKKYVLKKGDQIRIGHEKAVFK